MVCWKTIHMKYQSINFVDHPKNGDINFVVRCCDWRIKGKIKTVSERSVFDLF